MKPHDNRAWLLMLPAGAIMLTVGVVPLISVFNYSFHDIFTLQNLHWVGLDWYTELIRSDRFWGSLGRSLLFSGIVLSVQLPLGIWIALVLNSIMFLAETVAGVMSHSTGLIADGLNMLADATAYAIALVAAARDGAIAIVEERYGGGFKAEARPHDGGTGVFSTAFSTTTNNTFSGNGGDGMVAARLLHAWGAQPTVWLSHDPAALRGAAAHHLRSLQALAVPLVLPSGEIPTLPDSDLLIDALLGFGLSGAPTGTAARLIEAANGHAAPTLAVDLPSGLDARTGEPYAPCIRATGTLTLALPKTGLLAPVARPFVGDLAVADIGVPAAAYAHLGVEVPPLFGQASIVRVMDGEG